MLRLVKEGLQERQHGFIFLSSAAILSELVQRGWAWGKDTARVGPPPLPG
jgi:hypothetical protein